MTDRQNNSHEYWYICVPTAKFPEPKFHFGQQVRITWEDEFGNPCYDIGEIIGMQHTKMGNQPTQWYYRIRLLKSSTDCWRVGLDDEIFEPECHFVADNTAIAN